MKAYKFLWSAVVIGLIVVLISLMALPGFAQEPDGEEGEETLIEIHLPVTEPLVNPLDPESPYYNPNARYGAEGTRFGPPGERGEGYPPSPGPAFGTKVYKNKKVKGIKAKHRVYTQEEIVLNEHDDWLYAPTMMAPNECSLEVTTVYIIPTMGVK